MTTLKAQLEGLNQALLGLDIRSQEVENIRQSLLQANQQALSMPLLNGKLEQINFDQIEKQLNTIQMDMVKLAAMIMAGDEKLDSKLILNFLFSNKKATERWLFNLEPRLIERGFDFTDSFKLCSGFCQGSQRSS